MSTYKKIETTENDNLKVAVRLKPTKGNSKAIATGSINIADCFVINVTVYERKDGNGYVVSYPSWKDKEGQYHDSAYCMNKDVAKEIMKQVEDIINED